MHEFVEILFEKVNIYESIEFLKSALTDSSIESVNESNDCPILIYNSKGSIAELIPSMPDGSVYFSLNLILIDNIQFENVGLQIYKYGSYYDISVDVSLMEIKTKCTLEQLQIAIANLAKRLNAYFFCCGLEPATDLNTRFFSESNFGPLKY